MWHFLAGAAAIGLAVPVIVGGGDACRARNEALVSIAPLIVDHLARDNPLLGAGRALFNQRGEADQFAKTMMAMALKTEGDLFSCSLAYFFVRLSPDEAAARIAAEISKKL